MAAILNHTALSIIGSWKSGVYVLKEEFQTETSRRVSARSMYSHVRTRRYLKSLTVRQINMLTHAEPERLYSLMDAIEIV
jgi:hypothetical protein